MKNIILNVLKITVAGVLIWWLVSEGKIDFRQLGLFTQGSGLLVAVLGYWALVAVGVGAFRWWTLLRGIGISISYIRSVLYSLIGFFFNAAMPGAVGGDIVKGIYIIKSDGKGRKTPTLITILLDRVIGMAGLFTIAFAGVVFNLKGLMGHAVLSSLALATVLIFLGMVLFFLGVFFPIGKSDLLKQLFSVKAPGFGLLLKIYKSVCEYRKAPKAIIVAWLCSIVIQGCVILLMWYIASLLNLTGGIEFSVFLSITPLGILTTALPLAPGGMGVGHVAFDKILGAAGVSGGADIFNIFFISQLFLNLLGVIPYLLFKKPSEENIMDQAEAMQDDI